MTGKTVLITGSSKGLGKSLALCFAAQGSNIIIHGRNEADLRNVAAEVSRFNVVCDVVRGDITLADTIESLAQKAEQRNLDVLVNNAGIYKNALLQEMSADEYRQILETNLVAPIMMTRRIFPILQRKRSGVIVNINSLAGKNPTHGESAYCASKHGLRGFAKSIQFEAIKDNVDVIEVYLGTMNTGMVQGRREPDKCIQTKEAAESIYNLCLQHESLRLIESEFSRRLY